MTEGVVCQQHDSIVSTRCKIYSPSSSTTGCVVDEVAVKNCDVTTIEINSSSMITIGPMTCSIIFEGTIKYANIMFSVIETDAIIVVEGTVKYADVLSIIRETDTIAIFKDAVHLGRPSCHYDNSCINVLLLPLHHNNSNQDNNSSNSNCYY